jgi:hypothetical protein
MRVRPFARHHSRRRTYKSRLAAFPDKACTVEGIDLRGPQGGEKAGFLRLVCAFGDAEDHVDLARRVVDVGFGLGAAIRVASASILFH